MVIIGYGSDVNVQSVSIRLRCDSCVSEDTLLLVERGSREPKRSERQKICGVAMVSIDEGDV